MSQVISFASPEDVEQAFYEAIAKGDADRLIQLWAEDEDTLCVHPTGVRLIGLAPIRESWRGIFTTARIRMQAETIARWQSSVLAIHHLTEILFVGALGKMEMERVPKAGYKIEGLNITGLQRSLKLSNLMFPFRLISSLAKARSKSTAAEYFCDGDLVLLLRKQFFHVNKWKD